MFKGNVCRNLDSYNSFCFYVLSLFNSIYTGDDCDFYTSIFISFYKCLFYIFAVGGSVDSCGSEDAAWSVDGGTPDDGCWSVPDAWSVGVG